MALSPVPLDFGLYHCRDLCRAWGMRQNAVSSAARGSPVAGALSHDVESDYQTPAFAT